MNLPLFLLAFLLQGAAAGETAEAYRQQADQLLKDHRWTEAERLLRIGLEDHPDDSGLLRRLGLVHLNTGRWEGAERLLRQALDNRPDDAETRRLLGELMLRTDRLDEAAEFFRGSTQTGDGRAQAYYGLSFTLLVQGKDEAALENARRAVEAAPFNADYRRFYAGLLDHHGHFRESFEELKAALRIAPDNPALLFQMGSRSYSAGRLEEALDYLTAARDRDPENPIFRERLARLYRDLDRPEEADEQEHMAAALSEAFEAYSAALVLSQRGAVRRAVDLLEPVAERIPEFVSGRLLLARLYQRLGEASPAIRSYQQVLERFPSHPAALEGSAWISAREGKIEEAVRLLRSLQQKNPNVTLLEGYRLLLQEDWKGALSLFREVESEHPLAPDLLRLISLCLRSTGRWGEALVYLDRAGRLGSHDFRIREERRETLEEQADDLLEQGRWDEAVEAYSHLLREDGLQGRYFLRRAWARRKLGDFEGAVQDYNAGLEGDPEADWARQNLADAYYRLGRIRESAHEWRQVAERTDSGEAYFRLGVCLAHLEKFQEAEEAFEKALTRGHRGPELDFQLGVLRLRQEREIEALQLLRRSAEAGYEPARRMIRRQRR